MTRALRSTVSGLVFLVGGAMRAQPAPDLAEVLKVVEKQSQQIAEQNRLIQELSARVQALESKQTDTAVLAKGLSATADDLAAAKDDISTLNKRMEKRLGLGKHLEGMKVAGDLRLRQEFRERDRDLAEPDNANRDRLMARLRLGLVWNSPAEHWEVGVGLASGGADGRSANDTWGEDHLFEKGDLRLDYAYASHSWTLGQTPFTITFGQQRNPFLVTPLVWDDDLRPTGVSVQLGEPQKKDYAGAFATVGAYELYNGAAMGSPETEKNSDVYFVAAQAGYRFTSKPADCLFALGYRRITANYDDIRDQISAWRFNDANGNGTYDAPEVYTDTNRNGRWDVGEPLVDGNGNGVWDKNDGAMTNPYDPPADTASSGLWHVDQTEDFDVVDLLLDSRVSAGPVELRPYGQVAYNLGAAGPKSQQTIVRGYDRTTNPEDPADHALAWWLGLDATYGKLKLSYAYAYIGADAVFGPMRDSEFGISTGLTDTDVQGHKLGAAWNFTPNFSLSLNAYLLERIEGGSGNVGGTDYDQGSTYQIETLYRF